MGVLGLPRRGGNANGHVLYGSRPADLRVDGYCAAYDVSAARASLTVDVGVVGGGVLGLLTAPTLSAAGTTVAVLEADRVAKASPATRPRRSRAARLIYDLRRASANGRGELRGGEPRGAGLIATASPTARSTATSAGAPPSPTPDGPALDQRAGGRRRPRRRADAELGRGRPAVGGRRGPARRPGRVPSAPVPARRWPARSIATARTCSSAPCVAVDDAPLPRADGRGRRDPRRRRRGRDPLPDPRPRPVLRAARRRSAPTCWHPAAGAQPAGHVPLARSRRRTPCARRHTTAASC